MPRLVRGPLREVRSRLFDSARWEHFRPRPDDIIIATYPKCGTTWTQRIVGMLVFQSEAPFPPHDTSPWPDMRMRAIEETFALAEGQSHRRFLKSHLPYDALPIWEGVKIIHVARDGRDAAMSFHNHKVNYTPLALEVMSAVSLEDPKFGDRYAPANPDPAQFFRDWLNGDEDSHGDPGASYFHIEKSFWAARHDPNLLLVHYADLKADRAGEMRRIADFLGIDIPEAVWPTLIAAADFEVMKGQAAELMPGAQHSWRNGADSFLHKGTNGRWRDMVAPEDLERYDARVKAEFEPELAAWIEHGRLGAA